MFALFCFVLAVLALSFKSNSRLEAENAVLRHQLIVLRLRCGAASDFRTTIVGSLSSFMAGSVDLQVLTTIRPETLVRWHRSGFRCYWAGSRAHGEGARGSRRTSAG